MKKSTNAYIQTWILVIGSLLLITLGAIDPLLFLVNVPLTGLSDLPFYFYLGFSAQFLAGAGLQYGVYNALKLAEHEKECHTSFAELTSRLEDIEEGKHEK